MTDNELSRKEKMEIRKKLKEEGKNICYGPLCKGIIKSIDEFVKNLPRCIECNKHSIKSSRKTTMRSHRRIKFKLKLNKKCELCDCDDINMLEFDHISQEDKSFTISMTDSTKQILEEASKTRLLCVWCHRLHSKDQITKNSIKNEEDYEYTEEENKEIIDPLNSKICKGKFCNGQLRNSHFFYVSKNILSRLCIKCCGYRSMLNRIKNRNYVIGIKMRIGACQQCKIQVTPKTACCFDFDHIIRSTKLINIADLARRCYDVTEIIDNEILKCQLLCCYCHKKKTALESNYTCFDAEQVNKQVDMRINENRVKGTNICPICQDSKMNTSKTCVKCSKLTKRKIERPSYDILINEIQEFGYVGTGKKYGVSDNAIRRWVKYYEKYTEVKK